MKIAVTYENGNVYPHFGHTEKFKIYSIEECKIIKEEVIDTNGQGHGALAKFLKDNDINTLICGGIGSGAIACLEELKIEVCGGVSGKADEAVQKYLDGSLKFSKEANCTHKHDEKNHHCGSNCNHGNCKGN